MADEKNETKAPQKADKPATKAPEKSEAKSEPPHKADAKQAELDKAPESKTGDKNETEKKPLTDAQSAALDRDGDGKPGGSLSDAAIAQIKQDAYNEGYNDALIESRLNEQEMATSASAGHGDIITRSFLIATVLRLPEPQRRAGIRPRLEEMAAFLEEFPLALQIVAAEAIKAIGEARPADIANGRYKLDVRNAVRVASGETEVRPGQTMTPGSQEQARRRLDKVSNSNPVPSGFNAAPEPAGKPAKADPVLDGSEDQNRAAAALYKG